jgi:hypothetical protein
MRKKISITLISIVCLIANSCNQKGRTATNEEGRILRVPSEFSTIEMAVKNSADGDWIILAPGKYLEMKIDVDKAVTISSEWKLTGDELKIEETIIDSQDSILFNIAKDGVEISGLRIINGDHPLNIMARATIKYNHFVDNLDAMSYEGSGGGYTGYNRVENDRDDGLDLDIRYGGENRGSDIVVEHNTIINSNDDGIEIRLYDYPGQNIHYIIRENTIVGSNNAGIQIISYDIFTGKTFDIHHNIIRDCKTGLGCMEGTNSREDMSGATTMDELICFYNNTLTGNQMGATGGNTLVALNNLVQGNSLGGLKKFGKNSVVMNNLFYQNGGEDFIEFDEAVTREGNISSIDPLLDKNSYMPAVKSPCIDAGKLKYELNGKTILEVDAKYITGSAPDIGAVELNSQHE